MRLAMILAALGALALSEISAQQAFGQASLAAENVIDDVVVGQGGASESYTLFRDAREAEQWYYVPTRPRLVVRKIGNELKPQFSLLRYQFVDPTDGSKLIEEGLLQFALTNSASGEAFDAFRAAIKQRTGQEHIRISAIPFKAADVAIYSYGEAGKPSSLLAAAPYGSGIAPLFASQQMVFSLPLTKIGSDVMDALVNGQTGIPVAITFSFNALTPPAGFDVTVDYDQLYEHYSKDEKFAARASYYGLFGASFDSSSTEIRDSLINNKDISIRATTGEDFPISEIDKYLQPILAHINESLIEATSPPQTVNPAQAAVPSAGGYFGSAGYSVALKNQTSRRKGKESWSMAVQQIVERKTVASGLIGIGSFPKSIRDQLVTIVPPSKFKSLYMVLPLPALGNELNINSLDMTVVLKSGSNILDSRAFFWKYGSSSWVDVNGSEVSSVAFSLLNAAADDPELAHLKFETTLTVSTPIQTFTIRSEEATTAGQVSMPGVGGALFDVVEVDSSLLPFGKLEGQIVQGNLTLDVDGKVQKPISIKQRIVDGNALPPEPMRFLIPAAEGRAPHVSAQISFQLKGGKWAEWRYNGKDFEDNFRGLSVAIDEADLIE